MAVSESASAGLFRGPAAYEPRTPWPLLWALLAGVVIVCASILAASLLFVGSPATSGARQGMTELATLGIWQATTVVLTLAASALFGGKIRDVLALRVPAGAAVYLKGMLLMAALQVVVSLVQYGLFPQDMYADLRPFVRLFGEQWVLALLVVGVGAPLSEELLFRGFLLSALAALGGGVLGRSADHDGAVDSPARRLFDGGHRRGVPDRPFLLVVAVAHGQPAGRHLLPCALQLAHRTCAQVCSAAHVRGGSRANRTI